MVATRGWINESKVKATDLAKTFSDIQLASIITTDIATDGTLKGPNINSISEMAMTSSCPIIASGGVGSLADLISLIPLENKGVTGVIVGRAIYDKEIDLKEAIKVMENSKLQDSIKSFENFA